MPETTPPDTGKPMNASSGNARYGEVFDRGYARYDGPRRGRRGAITSLIGFSMKRAMGIRKRWTAKVLPFLLYAAITIPLVVQIGLSAIVPDVAFASYSGYLMAIFLVVGIFVGTAAPEIICIDRHERTLPLSFSRAIHRMDYVTAKLIAMTLLTMTMTVIPSALLWLGRQLVAEHVGEAMRENIGDLWRVIFAGSMIAIVISALGLAISSLTTRKGVAITMIMAVFVVLTGVANIGLEVLDEQDWSRYLIALHLPLLFNGMNAHLFGDVDDYVLDRVNLPLSAYLAYMVAVVVACVAILRWRYAASDDL